MDSSGDSGYKNAVWSEQSKGPNKRGKTMYGNPQRRTITEVQDLRRDGGRWLKEQRDRAGLSQRQLAERVGADYYTFISQLETGRGRIPPDRYRLWARALGQEPRDFVRELMRYYDPITHDILFEGNGVTRQAAE
jgi:ribosome-binding protein aMBF1 (putative translation factor)